MGVFGCTNTNYRREAYQFEKHINTFKGHYKQITKVAATANVNRFTISRDDRCNVAAALQPSSVHVILQTVSSLLFTHWLTHPDSCSSEQSLVTKLTETN